MKIALLEDDPDQAQVIKMFLECAHHSCSEFSSGQEFIEGVEHVMFDLFILDWEVPDKNGIEVLTWVRLNLGWNIPVLFMTMRDSKEDIVLALETGADDYMAKPIDADELIARINSLERRSRSQDDRVNLFTAGEFTFNISERTLIRGDFNIELTTKEFDLAVYLFRNIGRMLPRTELMEGVWGINADVNTRTVDTHISRLRKKLDLTPENGWKLSSIYHHGYRLEAVLDI